MQLTQPVNNFKNASDHWCDHFFSSCFNYTSSKWLIFQIEINKKHNFCKISYHSWFGTNDNKTSVIERKQNHKLWIIDTAFIRGFTCVLNFAISWIQCLHNEINNNNCVNFKKTRSQCVSLTEKVLHRNGIIKLNDSQVGKSEGFDCCDQPSNLIQTSFKSLIFSAHVQAILATHIIYKKHIIHIN